MAAPGLLKPRIYATNIPGKLAYSLNTREVTILSAPTGCGKSILLIDVLAQSKKKAIILIPNRAPVLALKNYASKLFPYYSIGFKMHGESNVRGYDNVTLMVTGYFLEYITHNMNLLNGSLVLAIDEAHDNSWQTDLCLSLIHI